MNGKWFSIAALIVTAIWLLSVASCGDDQQLVSISVTPSTETFGASNIPVIQNMGSTVQLRALGTYVHPPVTKDITDQVTWASNTPGMVMVNSTGLITATGLSCGGTLISATVQTNADASGLSASGAIVTGYMTANVVCFVSSSGGSGGGEPTLTLDFAGGGSGFVTSTPSGLSCFSTDVSCVTSFPTGTPVTLTATPSPPSTSVAWSVSGCSGASCSFALQDDTIVTVTFN